MPLRLPCSSHRPFFQPRNTAFQFLGLNRPAMRFHQPADGLRFLGRQAAGAPERLREGQRRPLSLQCQEQRLAAHVLLHRRLVLTP